MLAKGAARSSCPLSTPGTWLDEANQAAEAAWLASAATEKKLPQKWNAWWPNICGSEQRRTKESYGNVVRLEKS